MSGILATLYHSLFWWTKAPPAAAEQPRVEQPLVVDLEADGAAKPSESDVDGQLMEKQLTLPPAPSKQNNVFGIEDMDAVSLAISSMDSYVRKYTLRPLGHNVRFLHPPPNNLEMAITNIKIAGTPFSEQDRPFVELLLADFYWKASSPNHNDSRHFTEITQDGYKHIPGLYPILDPYWWKDMDPTPHMVEEFYAHQRILYGSPSGFYFLEEHDDLFFLGTNLQKIVEKLYILHFEKDCVDEEMGWEEIPRITEEWGRGWYCSES
jgi:hypothetical protein